jgi:hypothetical protein
MLVLDCSTMVLQACARVDLVCGLAASVRHELRHCSKDDLYCARCASGTLLVTQASYLAMKSSHSATPIFSPLEAVVEDVVLVVVVVDVVFEVPPLLAVVVLVVLVVFVVLEEESVPPQATSSSPKTRHSARGIKVLFNN